MVFSQWILKASYSKLNNKSHGHPYHFIKGFVGCSLNTSD